VVVVSLWIFPIKIEMLGWKDGLDAPILFSCATHSFDGSLKTILSEVGNETEQHRMNSDNQDN